MDVVGTEKFRTYFAGHEDQYVVIGGTACSMVFNTAGLPFRNTKDFDMVLCVGAVDKAFAEAFKAFLDDGGYQARERGDGTREFYRFHKPTDESFPFMVELFSRQPGTIDLGHDATLTPIPVEEDLVSLSAILLEDGYYEALQAAKKQLDGITIIDQDLLIPFKARAFLDLSRRSEEGEKIDSKNIKKHRNDVFRLAQLLPMNSKIDITEPIRDDLRAFIDIVEADKTLDPKSFGVPIPRDDVIDLLSAAYGL